MTPTMFLKSSSKRLPPPKFNKKRALLGIIAFFATGAYCLIFIITINLHHKALSDLDSHVHGVENLLSIRSALYGTNHKKQKSMRKIKDGPEVADGTFNTFPIYYKTVEDGWHSNAHCIGDNFSDKAWQGRSCHFENLCFDTEEMTYVIFTSPEQVEFEKALQLQHDTHFSVSSSMETSVSIGGINPKWSQDLDKLKWHPQLLPVEKLQSIGYYALGPDSVLIPYHSLAGQNPGHLVWDDFLPIYTLLTGFGLLEKDLVLVRQHFEPALWASCQFKYSECKAVLNKFYPLIGTMLQETSTQNDTVLEIHGRGEKKSKYVCSRNGAAGLGMLTDHGLKFHGWKPNDYLSTHNHGRSASLYSFRNWMMKKIGVESTSHIHKPPYRIIFSEGSSNRPERNMTFTQQAKLIEDKLGDKYALDIVEVNLSTMSLKDQLELANGASIFVTVGGGGAVTAMFLPRGASLFVYYQSLGKTHIRLDWDLFNNMGHIRTHWLRRDSTTTTETGLHAFVKLVEHELDVISHANLLRNAEE